MTVSVVIATFNRAPLLEKCLDQLGQQPFEAGDEIIVVDNGSTDHTARIVTEAVLRLSVRLRYLSEPAPGKSKALARALAVAIGDVLVFTDDDVLVDARWLDAIRNRMSDESIALMGGPVVARWEQKPPRWLTPAANGLGRLSAPLALLDYGPDVVDLGPRTVLGANMAVRRDVMLRIGGFARHLGKLRGTLLSGEDHDLCQRIQAAGFRAVYDPAASVHHWVPRERMRVAYHLSWFFWSGITHASLDREPTPGRSLLGVPLYLVRRAATASVGAAASAATGNSSGVVERLIEIAFAAGYTAHRWRRNTWHPVLHVGGDRA
jgi:glucosyl-dolichyl phosphate glucuronosyltransferase